MSVLVDMRSESRVAAAADDRIEIAIVNNMPDAALAATERQFVDLIEAAAGDADVRLTFFSLPDVPRAERGQSHLARRYHDLHALWDQRPDALIVTGTEPRAADLRHEPYWPALAELIDWAEHNTVSTVWSCLAAHAAVLQLDGIARHALADKCFGVFECAKGLDHPLTAGLAPRFAVPHSRWNELRESELVTAGYDVLTRSPRAGADLFVRQRRSLFVFFQGHPEYDAMSLLGEYRRDFARFLRRERETCPALPRNYFDAATADLLTQLRERALADRREASLAEFPLARAERGVRDGWRPGAARIYANWLALVRAHKAERRGSAAGSVVAPRSNVVRAAFGGEPRLAVAGAQAAEPARAPAIDRRRRGDQSGVFTGPRDRRAFVRP